MHLSRRRIYVALAANVVCFGLLLVFTKPLYGGTDDVYCLYLLSGGFGFKPSELICYNYALHPAFTLILKHLFIITEQVNWYSVLLIFLHFIGCTSILNQMLRIKNWEWALVIYSVFFAVFESVVILHLTFTNTSIILALTALVHLICSLNGLISKYTGYALFLVFIVLAAFMRIHSIIPFAVITIPFLVLWISKKMASQLLLISVLGFILIVLSSHFREGYYEKMEQGWRQEEEYKQKLYLFYNNGAAFSHNVQKFANEFELIKYGLIIDTNYLSSKKLLEMKKIIDDEDRFSPIVFDTNIIRWAVINNRIFIIAWMLMFFLAVKNKRIFFTATCSFLLFGTIICFLSMHYKVPAYIIEGGFAIMFLLLIFSVKWDERFSDFHNKISFTIAACIIIWGVVRIYKIDRKNRAENFSFKMTYTEVAAHRDKLFIVTDMNFPFAYFSVWDLPQKFQLPNVITNWHDSYSTNLKMLKKHNINNVKDLPKRSDVLFWGKPIQGIINYFDLFGNEKFTYSSTIDEFKYGEVRKLIADKKLTKISDSSSQYSIDSAMLQSAK